MADYRYLFTNLISGQVVAELPLTGVQYAQSLNDAGDASGHLMLSDLRMTSGALGKMFDLDAATMPSRTGFYVERDGLLEWGGVIWSRQYDSSSQTVSIAGREFESYLGRRRVNKTNVFNTGTDVFTVVKTLVNQVQALPYGDIGISTSGIGLAGQGIPDVFAIYDYEKRNLLDTISDLSKQDAPYGFDFHVDVAYDSSYNITRNLVLSYPHKGNDWTEGLSGQMMEFPGSIVSYRYPEDGTGLVNTLYGFGPGSSDGQYITSRTSGSSFAQGFPVLEDVITYSQIPNPRVVDSLTQAQVNSRDTPNVVMEATWTPAVADWRAIAPTVAPSPAELNIGDQIRIRINDDRFTTGFDAVLRMVKFTVAVGDNGGPELITGSFVPVTY